MSTMTLASVYELQGLKSEALDIYKDLLQKDPHNDEARSAIKRILGMRKKFEGVNEKQKEAFVNIENTEQRYTFERWLIWN